MCLWSIQFQAKNICETIFCDDTPRYLYTLFIFIFLGNSGGSLSSLNSGSDADEDLEFEYLNNFGPR